MSTTKSSAAPCVTVTYLAWPSGKSAKWIAAHDAAARDRGVRLREVKGVSDRLGQEVVAVPLQEESTVVPPLNRGDFVRVGDGELTDLHVWNPSRAFLDVSLTRLPNDHVAEASLEQRRAHRARTFRIAWYALAEDRADPAEMPDRERASQLFVGQLLVGRVALAAENRFGCSSKRAASSAARARSRAFLVEPGSTIRPTLPPNPSRRRRSRCRRAGGSR